ncbi:hypothetical protein HBB16_17675 [Pseudonocardia sp. MCCB 268]|nr:hypothetical protein [Pseudonocardia cytotoxica]
MIATRPTGSRRWSCGRTGRTCRHLSPTPATRSGSHSPGSRTRTATPSWPSADDDEANLAVAMTVAHCSAPTCGWWHAPDPRRSRTGCGPSAIPGW